MRILFVSSGKENGIPGPIIKSQAESINSKGYKVAHFSVDKKGLNGYLQECIRLRRVLKKNQYDIIHAHYGLTAIISLLAKRNQKLVVSFMGDDLVGSRKADGNITKLSILFSRINACMAKWFYDFSIVKSNQMAKQLFKDTKFEVVPNGVNISKFNPESKQNARKKLRISPDREIAIFVSKPERVEKNFNLAKNAVDKLNNSNLQLLPVFGVKHSELATYFNAADVLVLSSFHEGSPNVIKEAMACNCPIVSTKVGDVEWIIGNTKGCYIASFDSEDFGGKLNQALEFSKSSIRTNGRKRIMELSLDDQSVAEKLIDIYNMVLSSTK
ncbi:MAG: glycosyltransferase family 4 protein [Bacteroidota bacterium]